MGSLLLVTGPPGAGKSSVAAVLVGHVGAPSVLVEGDRFFGFLAGDRIDPWLTEAHEQNEVVTRAAAAATGAFVAGGYVTVYDGMVGPWFLPAFAAAAGVAELDYVVLLPPLDTCLARVAGRRLHGFTDAAAAGHMHAEFDTAGVAERHVVRADGDVEQVAHLVLAARARGALRHRAGGGAASG